MVSLVTVHNYDIIMSCTIIYCIYYILLGVPRSSQFPVVSPVTAIAPSEWIYSYSAYCILCGQCNSSYLICHKVSVSRYRATYHWVIIELWLVIIELHMVYS